MNLFRHLNKSFQKSCFYLNFFYNEKIISKDKIVRKYSLIYYNRSLLVLSVSIIEIF